MISPAQMDTLKAVVKHKNAIRVQGRTALSSDYKWCVGGEAQYGTVERLYNKGLLEIVDRDTLTISERGRRALGKQAA